MTNQADEKTLRAYLKGALSPADVAALEARLESDAALAKLLEVLEESEDAAPIDDLYDLPPELDDSRPAGFLGSVLWMLFSGVLTAVFAYFVLVHLGDGDAAQTPLAAQISTDAGGLIARADPASGTLTYTADLQAPPEGQDHVLWLLVDDGAPLRLGVLSSQGAGSVSFPPFAQAQARRIVLAISEEAANVSAGGQPSGRIVGFAPLISK